jgi:hypothetical protein
MAEDGRVGRVVGELYHHRLGAVDRHGAWTSDEVVGDEGQDVTLVVPDIEQADTRHPWRRRAEHLGCNSLVLRCSKVAVRSSVVLV